MSTSKLDEMYALNQANAEGKSCKSLPEPRRSSRQTKPTEKAREGKVQDLSIKFDTAYQKLVNYITKQEAIKADASVESLQEVAHNLTERRAKLVQLYDNIRDLSFGKPPDDVVTAVDRACSLVDRNCKRIHRHLSREGAKSVVSFGSFFTRKTTSSRRSKGSSSHRQEIAIKAAALEAELVAKNEEAEHEDELRRLELEEEKRKMEAEAEIQRRRRDLERKKLEQQLRIEQAKLEVLDLEVSDQGSDVSDFSVLSASVGVRPRRLDTVHVKSEIEPPVHSQARSPPKPAKVKDECRSPSCHSNSRHRAQKSPARSQSSSSSTSSCCTCASEDQLPLEKIKTEEKPHHSSPLRTEEPHHSPAPHAEEPYYSSPLRADAMTFVPMSPTRNDDIKELSQALIASVALNRLPVPEPSVFTGDPMEYPDWNASFTALVESHAHIKPQEKIYYLKRYLGGEAKKAVSGYFLLKSENAYLQARKILEERFGDPYTIADHFRKKLANWPKIEESDGAGLRRLADFLSQCEAARCEIKGLSILDDPQEGKKILRHLPDYLIKSWNRRVARHKKSNGSYPDFATFTKFISDEAEIACDPVTSLSSVKSKGDRHDRERNDKPKRRGPGASTMATETRADDAQKPPADDTQKSSCIFCKRTNHQLKMCRSFASKKAEEKTEFVKANRLCFGCLSPGHMSRDCQNRDTCKKCERKHPTCLHEDRGKGSDGIESKPESKGKTANSKPKDTDKKSAQTETKKSSPSNSGTKSSVCNTGSSGEPISSMVVPVWISTRDQPDVECLVYALLDTQSDTTFVLGHIAEGLPSTEKEPTKLRLTTMTSKDLLVDCHKYKDLVIRGYDSDIRVKLPNTYSREHIPLDESHIPTPETAERWPHLREVASKIQPILDCEVGLLIGYNCPQALAPRRCITGVGSEPFAICTDLGWSIVGCASLTDDSGDAIGLTHLTISQQVDERLIAEHDLPGVNFVFKASVKEEHLYGTMEPVMKMLESDFTEHQVEDKNVSQNDLKFIKIIQEGIHQQEDGYFCMPLPFSHGRPDLPNNRGAAICRLRSLKRRMVQDERYATHYKSFVQEILDRGDAEIVPEDTVQPDVVWYIPHHGVYHPKKPDKIRVVFDCSAKFKGTSLNDHLLPGPDLINPLIGVLCRFRQEPVAFMCDVEKMFHQFRVNQEDQDYLRFLWWEGGDLQKEPVDYRMKVHLFGAVSSPGCANFGLKEVARRYQHINSDAARFIERNFYVDDGLKSILTSDACIRLLLDSMQICRQGNMRLHKIVSNSKEVMEAIPESERASGTQDLSLTSEDAAPERALGIQWVIEADEFCFRLTLKDLPLTRRGILATVASIYDPIGFLAPFVLRGKLILQEICKEGTNWDDVVPDGIRAKWEQWRQELATLKDVHIPRCYKPADFGETSTAELHHFSDASTEGYGQCSYIRLKNKGGDVCCSFVMGKARVTPRKHVTIPRLELQAAVTSVKISNLLNVELEYASITNYFWSDSKVVLGYIQNDAKRFHTYVANRVQRIRDSSNPNQWRYVSTSENPADHASRGLEAGEISTSSWLSGPEFLSRKDLTLEPEIVERHLSADDPEVRKTTTTLATSTTVDPGLLGRLDRFSDWSTAIKALTALRSLAKKKSGNTCGSAVEERQATEVEIIKWVQEAAFPEEIKALKDGTERLPKGNRLRDLDPILDDGILRVGGRLRQSSLLYGVKHPIILPKKGHVTQLIILHFHKEIAHQGRGMTINQIRSSGYWVVGCSTVVASAIHKCFICRKNRGATLHQKMAELPKERAEPSPPFTTSGMDCFGPFVVKEGRKDVKRYGVVFTCLALRAVHIEVLDDMTTDAMINGLRCLFAIRGKVRLIRCDQGSNFVGAKQELKQALKEIDNDQVRAWLMEHQCEFQMNPPSASHMGGVWERQIRSIRTILDGLLENASGRLDTSSLRTLMYEAMAIVNGRPLTVESINDPKAPVPLTPNHFLTMKSTVVPPLPGEFVQEDIYARKRWRKVQHLANEFWQRWRKEYLLSLQCRRKWQGKQRNLEVGDIVILREEGLVRGQWHLARVTEATPGNDGLVRSAKLLMSTSELDKKGKRLSKPTVLERPIHKLTLLVEHDASPGK